MHHNFIDEDIDLDDEVAPHGVVWQLVCLQPSEGPDSTQVYPISLGELRLIQLLEKKLNLVLTRDDKRRRLYLSNDFASPFEDEQDPETIGWLRYPSNWMVKVVPDDEASAAYEAIEPEAAAPLIPAFPDAQLSEHFQLSEFRPGEHSYDLIRISPVLIQTLEVIRERVGEPLILTSGYRPVAYNRKVGGVSNSLHIDGLAADITTEDMSTEELHAICDEVIGDRGGVGFYPRQEFVHVDLRGYRARWSGR